MNDDETGGYYVIPPLSPDIEETETPEYEEVPMLGTPPWSLGRPTKAWPKRFVSSFVAAIFVHSRLARKLHNSAIKYRLR